MTNAIRKLLSLVLAAVLLLSVIASAVPVTTASAAAEVTTAAEESASDLRIGVLSDIHVSYDYVDEVYGSVTGHFNGVQPSRLEKALRFFKSKGVDAVVIAGDLQEASGTDEASLDKQKDWLQTVVDIWFEVFPEKEGEEGYVEPIFTYGNHDSALVSAQYWPEEWGTYEDVFIKEVNGYSFVCTHNSKESLAAPLLEKVAANSQDKPIFYIQHCPVYYTVPGDYGYGQGYGAVGWKNVAPYHNAVVLNGHTHVPLTDERSIWQGDEGNEGQFTVINTATINYTGLNNDGMSVNGNAQSTEHGLLIDVTGSEISIDRYSFHEMELDDTTNTVSGEAEKLGETWSFDACDITDRPYAYDSRYENANAPEFAEGTQVTVDAVTDTSVTVTVPVASVTPPSGFSDLVEAYVVEACNPTSGEVEATGRKATSYHVDSATFEAADSYTVTVSGLEPGTSYTLKIYAQEFFDKRSEPIEVSVTTTGDLTTYRTGDINYDGAIDQTDMELLQSTLTSGNLIYNAAADIDANGILETRDIAELQAILDATYVTYPESTDLMDLVHQVKLTGVATKTEYQPVDYGTVIQNSVVRGDSNQAVKTWTTNYAYYPVTTMYFSEPVDLSGYTHLSFDTLFENEFTVSNSYAKRWLSVSLISGNQEQVASYGSMNFDPNGDGWTTTTIILSNLKNIDLTAVTGIQFSHNFDYYEGRFDGETEHAIYWDNIYGLVIEGTDSDMLASATIAGGEAVYGAGYTKNTSHAVSSTGGTLDVTFAEELLLSEYAGINVDMRTSDTATVTVQPYDVAGSLIGSSVSIESCYIYQNKYISIPAFGVEDGIYAAGLRFSYSCDSLLLDSMSARASKDTDLIGTAQSISAVGDGVSASIVLDGTNGSNNALSVSAGAAVSGGAEITLDTAHDLTETPYLRMDLKMENTDLGYGVVLYNSAGDEIWRSTDLTASSSNGEYATYEIDLSDCADLTDVAKIAIDFELYASGNIWIDNLKACNPLVDFFGASTGLIGPSSVQDGFICEIMPTTDDGHTNVLHWYSDPENGSGTTSAWPGETTVTINKDVLLANHSGYDASAYDYLEFTMKNIGNYVAFSFSFKDASGATLGSSNGEYRVSLEEDWCTYRIDLASAGLTADEVAQIQTISMGWNWQYQNVNGSETKKVADIYIDNMGFCAYPEDTTDKLDQIGLIRNSEWWYGGHNTYPGAGWLYQSDVTAGSDKAFMFYRSAETSGMGYSPRILYAYFTDPITVESDWIISLDVINENFAKNSRLEIIGSDGKAYTCFTFSGTGSYSLEAAVSTLATSDGVAFDPATVTIKGLEYYTNYNPDSTVSTAEGGYLVLDNLTISAPPVVPTINLDGADIIGSADSVVISNASSVEDGFVFEVLETVDDRDNVIHMYADPANGGGYTNTSSYYMGAVISLPGDYVYNATGVDFIEINLKNSNIYCDQLYIEVLDSAGTKLGGAYKRIATSNDWSYYRIDLATLGLTEEELSTIATVNVMVNWSKQLTTAASPVAGEVYIDNLTFGSYVDESVDLFDHVASVQNVEWWWSGNNYYDNAGWLMEEDADGSSYFQIYRVKDKSSTSTGYSPRRQYLYFDEPITLTENMVVTITAVNTNMGTGSKISLLGDDGNKYGYLLIDQTGTNTYELAITDFVLLNADTTMTKSETAIDVSAVKIKGVILHNDFFSGDAAQDGSIVMDDLRIYDPAEEEEPTEPDTTEPETTEPETTEPAVDGGDLLYSASLQYDKTHWADGTGLTYAKDTENVCGEKSVQSWAYHATAEADNSYATAQMMLDKAYDMTDCYLAFDAKYVTESTVGQYIGVRLHNSGWGNHNDVNVGVTLTAGDWNTYILDFADVLLDTADLSDLKLISFYFNFSSNTGYERTVYIDNVRLLHKETVEEDWINMSIDSGMSENVTYKVVTDHTYGDSSFAMKVETGDGYRMTFNTQAAVSNGTLSEKVNMANGGYIGGYFYFGDQDPDVKIRLTDVNWNGGASLALDLIDVGDGWYYAYKDVSQFYFYDSANNPTKEEIIRVSVVLPSNYTVYIDQLCFPTYIPAELVDYRIVYDADGSKAVASDVAVRLENDLSLTVGIVPDTVIAAANEIVLGSAARENDTVASYLTGGENELGDFDYAVVVEDGKIYLAANSNAGLYQALDKLVDLASAGSIADGVYLKDAYDTTDSAELAEGSDIRVMSYNVLYSTEYLVEDRIGNFLNILGYYTPDVIGLQETSSGSNAGWHEYIQDSLVADDVYLKACKDSESVSGLMTTFLYNPDTVELIDEYVIDLEEGSQIRVLAVAVFERISDGQQFVVTNTHPAPYGSANYSANLEALLTAAAAELEKYADLPVIMVGDFNTEEGIDEYQTILSTLGVSDAKYSADTMVRAYNTWSGFGVDPVEGSDYCIDHIFVNGNVDPVLYNIVIDHDVQNTSDHIPLYADIKLSAPAEPEMDEDFFYNATISNGEKQSEITNDSLISWKITPAATGWSYPTFTLDKAYDISKYELVMDIYPANMTNFRMHLATIDGKWISGAAVYYDSDKWTTVTYNLSANSEGLTEATSFGLGICFGSEGTDYALYIDNVRLVERKVNADATEDTEQASDILSIASFEWSGSDWSGEGALSYTNQSDETNGKDSLRSWRFSRVASTGNGYARAQLKLNATYDLTDKDLVFDIKFDTGEEIAAHNFGIIFHDSAWTNIFPNDNYMEPTITAKAGDWYTVRLDNSVLRAFLLDGKDLSAVYLMNFCFQFTKAATDIYIDNMHLEDHVYGTDDTDAASDLLVNATIVESTADDSVYFYEHSNTSVAYGESSNASHKFYATASGSGYHTVKYDLGQSYDLTGKNVVMDVFAFRCSTTFLFQLYDSENNLITSFYRGCANRKWSEVTPAILSNDLDLTDVRYMVIGAHFQADSTLTDRAFYVDNVRIEQIDTYHTALENKNMVFIGDSITASGGYKGWSGELEEHYFINRYNIGAGGTSYATISGRGQIYSQTANIPTDVNVDYFVLNGGVNDIWSAWDLGSVSSVSVEDATVDSFDTDTTAGGMEQMFCYLRTNYPNAKIAFIITYNCFDSGFDSVRYRDEFVPLAKAVCEKWDVPYLDLVNNDAFNTEFNALPGVHTYDGVHANDVGYDLVMRQLAPWLLSLNDATEQTEQNSDLLAYAAYEWSASDWTGASTLSYDNACDVTSGPDSLRSWKFSATAEESGWPAMQIKLSQLQKTSLTGKALQFDVKFEASNGTPTQKIGMRVYDDTWTSIIGTNVIWKEVSGSDWQTVTIDASEFEAIMTEGCSLDVVYLVQFLFDFSTNTGNTQTVYVDNLRVVDANGLATDETEAASDLLYGAKYVSGSFTNKGFGYDQYNTMYVNGSQSKYSLRLYAADDVTAWCNARFELPEALDLTNKTLQFDVNQYNHVYIGVALYNSANELVTSDGFTIRNEGWQTFEVNLLGGFADGMTEADLSDIKYINFSSSFEYVKTGRVLYIDNVTTYDNEQYDTVIKDLNGLYMGDSISEAISYKGWAGELAEHYGVNSYNVSVSGSTLANDGIYSQLEKAPTDVAYDFIMLNGGVNDVWRSISLGEVTAEGTTEFDTATAIGALEHLFSSLKTNYPDAEICYVLNYVCVQTGYPSDSFANDFAPLARTACEKWDIHCLDLVDNAEFTAEFDATAKVHTYDGVHANTAGYNVLTKYIAPWLIEIFSIVEANEETEAASDLAYSSTIGAGGFTAAKTFLSYDKACTEEVYGDQSLYSLKIAYDGTENENHDSWPYLWINFGKDVDFTGKKLVFDVKIVCEVAAQGLSVRQLLNSSWSSISSTTKGANVTAGEWTTVEFDMADFVINEGYSLENVNLFGLQFAFTKGVAETVYIDNVRLVDA